MEDAFSVPAVALGTLPSPHARVETLQCRGDVCGCVGRGLCRCWGLSSGCFFFHLGHDGAEIELAIVECSLIQLKELLEPIRATFGEGKLRENLRNKAKSEAPSMEDGATRKTASNDEKICRVTVSAPCVALYVDNHPLITTDGGSFSTNSLCVANIHSTSFIGALDTVSEPPRVSFFFPLPSADDSVADDELLPLLLRRRLW